MSYRNSLRSGTSLRTCAIALILAGAAVPSIAAAQTTQPPVPDTEEDGQPVADDDTDENVIVVSGFRAALESAVNEKRNSDPNQTTLVLNGLQSFIDMRQIGFDEIIF